MSHTRAVYTLASRGEGDSFAERDGYNLMTFRQSDLLRWGSKYKWKAGCTDMSHLPEAVSATRNVANWSCVNTSVGGNRVVFKRASPGLRCRGCAATARRTKFKWTEEMTIWFNNRTRHLVKKSIGFVELRDEAFVKWGCRAPEQEHLENRIKSRDQARKEGREVKWATAGVVAL